MANPRVWTVTDVHVYRSWNGWWRVVETWKIALHPTKGWRKVSRVDRAEEHSRFYQKGWRGGSRRQLKEDR